MLISCLLFICSMFDPPKICISSLDLCIKISHVLSAGKLLSVKSLFDIHQPMFYYSMAGLSLV